MEDGAGGEGATRLQRRVAERREEGEEVEGGIWSVRVEVVGRWSLKGYFCTCSVGEEEGEG